MLIQQKEGRSNFFNRSWAEFKVGFRDPSGNYWIGNDRLSQLTANGRYKLKFDLQVLITGKWYWAEYSTFRVMTEADNYKLRVSGFSGNAGFDAFGDNPTHGANGMMFTTYDRDNDLSPRGNCAMKYGGGF